MLDLLGLVLLRAFAFFARLLPLKVALGLGTFLARVIYFFRMKKGIAYLNLKAAFEGVHSLSEIKKIGRQSLENFSRTVVEVLRFPVMDRKYYERYCEIPHFQIVTNALKKGKGVIYVTPHFGNWEFLAVAASFTGYPVKVLVREQRLKRLGDYLNRLRMIHGARMIGRRSSVKEFIRALREGSVVAITADQGSKDGLPVEFFGRRTLAPQGFLEIARRTGAPVIPVFDVWERKGNFHRVHVLPELSIHREEGGEEKIREDLQNYYRILEGFIRRHPEQWLWDHKRWKYCFTKTVLVLSDGKTGHESQSKALLEIFAEIQKENPAYEFRTHVVRAEFKSSWHRHLLSLAAPLILPWIRGRIDALRPFLTETSFKTLAPIYTDFVISCGSSLLPLNLLVAKENRARSIVLMKPPFPFNRFRYDLIIAPRHDEPVKNQEVVYTEMAPNLATEAILKKEAERLSARLGLNGKRVVSVFVGGDSRKYSMRRQSFEEALNRILEIAKDSKAEILVTTSRRTSEELSEVVKHKLAGEPCCRLLVIANEANIENVTYGMMGVSDTIFVTEDSVSMISEAASAGKKVVILKLGKGKLPPKYARFQKNLEAKHLAKVLAPNEITRECLDLQSLGDKANLVEEGKALIKEKLVLML